MDAVSENRGETKMMEKCINCGKILDEDVPHVNIPHTDIYYCYDCLYRDNKKEKKSPK